jgi:eukaryotic-like serine/threonine-protein kinase
VQAVVMVRDDFWMAATRFMDELEIELLKGQNTAAVDLFDLRHARKVLTAFGIAYGALPDRAAEISRDQHAFLGQAINDLAENGKISSVRLALFADMVKGKPWTPATFREVGGTKGVGVTFLEETFSSPQANPKHRLHQKAAQAVLKALLPETGTDIKGKMKSEQELREVAASTDRPRNFADLIHILDNEVRLITPTDPQGWDGDSLIAFPSKRFYQLTHDFLVHSLRDWLTRKQRETRRGRAELVLEDRYAIWKQEKERRYLPSLTEAVAVILFLGLTRLQTDQKTMIKSALTFRTFALLYDVLIALFLLFFLLFGIVWLALRFEFTDKPARIIFLSLIIPGCLILLSLLTYVVYSGLARLLSRLSRVFLPAKK